MAVMLERVKALPPMTSVDGAVLEAAALVRLVQDSRMVGTDREFTIGAADGCDPGNDTAVPAVLVRRLRDQWKLIEPCRVSEPEPDEGSGVVVRYGLTRLGAAAVAYSRSRRARLAELR